MAHVKKSIFTSKLGCFYLRINRFPQWITWRTIIGYVTTFTSFCRWKKRSAKPLYWLPWPLWAVVILLSAIEAVTGLLCLQFWVPGDRVCLLYRDVHVWGEQVVQRVFWPVQLLLVVSTTVPTLIVLIQLHHNQQTLNLTRKSALGVVTVRNQV